MKISFAAILALAACAPSVVALPPMVPMTQIPEAVALPADPSTEPLPAGTPTGQWTVSLEKGSCLMAAKPCPSASGIFMSEESAIRLGFYKIDYDQLRANYVGDRGVWKAQRQTYETQLQQADKAIQSLQPTWWQRHAFEIGLGIGVLSGAFFSVSIFRIAVEAK